MDNETVLNVAKFDPKVKIYWYFQGIWVHALLVMGLIGIITLPCWIIGGWFICTARYNNLHATLTSTSIHLKKGVITKVEKTIPLEKIQDLGMRTGPLLNLFGLASIQIETAGGGAQQGSDMVLAGVVQPEVFRNAVLSQREKASGKTIATTADGADSLTLLTEIRDSLHRLEKLMAK